MEKFNLILNIPQESYANIDIKSVVLILSDYFAEYGDNEEFKLTCAETGEIVTFDTKFTNGRSEMEFLQLFDLLPYWNRIASPQLCIVKNTL